MSKKKSKKISKAFVKTLVLVIVFCVLILFSIHFFNRDQNVLSEVPLVNNIFDFVINVSDWIDKNINEKVDFGRFFRQN